MKKKKVLIIAAAIAAVIIIIAVVFIININKDIEYINNMQIANIDFSQIEDGKYYGECRTSLIYVKVEVIVSQNKITQINILKHDNGKGKAAEAITESIIEQNSLQFDAVAGATHSNKVILKAVENALTQ